MIIGSIFFAVFTLTHAFPSVIKTCDRRPVGISTPKSTNSHQFRISIKGDVDFYEPNKTYTVSLQGIKNKSTITPSFISFSLMVEAEDYRNYDEENNEFIAGKFQLTGDVRTKISEVCPNTITQTSLIQKSEIQVFWTSPLSGSGCVVFRATVVEYRDIWYMDDDQLTKRLCEESNESNDENANVSYDCCACDEAKFELTFEGLWSRHTHPKDYPDDNWQTRFSDVIGASHTIDYRFWEQGKIASEGMHNIAQSGSTSTLESELKFKSDKIRTIIKARGISYPNVTGKTFAVFRVDRIHHLISVVSFMYPSPDWFVGISGLELCLPNCNWVTNKTVNLYPWDAGTDSGFTYSTFKTPQVPRMNIDRVQRNDTRSPFYDSMIMQMKPIAKLHLMRQRLYEKSCVEETSSEDCVTGPWSDWEKCSTTCGSGYSNRQRHYIKSEDATKPECNKTLKQRKGCYVLNSCSTMLDNIRIIDPKCDVTSFGQWSDCSAECGPGVMARFRTILNEEVSPKYCETRMILQQTENCIGIMCHDEHEIVDLNLLCSNCSLSDWGLWSPCSSKCGPGQRERSRLNLNLTSESCDTRCFNQTINCIDNPPCENTGPMETFTEFRTENITTSTIDNDETNNDSSDNKTDKCSLSKWSTFTECSTKCGDGYRTRTRYFNSTISPIEQKKCRKKLIDRRKCIGKDCECKYCNWSDWSLCSAPCGMNAVQQRTRIPTNSSMTWCKERLEQRICSALACKSN